MKIQRIYLNNDGTITGKKIENRIKIKKDSVDIVQNNSLLNSDKDLVKQEEDAIIAVPLEITEVEENKSKSSKKKKEKSDKLPLGLKELS